VCKVSGFVANAIRKLAAIQCRYTRIAARSVLCAKGHNFMAGHRLPSSGRGISVPTRPSTFDVTGSRTANCQRATEGLFGTEKS
jgi:hypothetical protein